MGRKLLFFFDGSSNTIVGPKHVVPTNVYYLNQAVSNGSPHSPQISFYFSGVGTHGDRLSAATGRGFDEIVINAYTNLSSNYQEGDKIYLFGFSRGAAAARGLSALISWPGLLKDTALVNNFPDIWQLYTQFPPGIPTDGKSLRLRQDILNKVESSNALWNPRPKVTFLGAFDTVPGCSWDREKIFIKLRITNLALESCVEKAVQLLSVDDNRIPSFEPLLWDSISHSKQHIEQIWIPGVHSDIGGSSDAVFIGYIALLTMLSRIRELCPELELEPEFYNEILRKAESTTDLNISDERPTLPMRFLEVGARTPGNRPGELVHQLLREMHGARVIMRGRERVYKVRRTWLEMPCYTPPFSESLRGVVARHHKRRRASL